jgi:hypothetical protein
MASAPKIAHEEILYSLENAQFEILIKMSASHGTSVIPSSSFSRKDVYCGTLWRTECAPGPHRRQLETRWAVMCGGRYRSVHTDSVKGFNPFNTFCVTRINISD